MPAPSLFRCFVGSPSSTTADKDSEHEERGLRDRHDIGTTSFNAASTNGGASVSACNSSLSAASIQTLASIASLPSLQISSLLLHHNQQHLPQQSGSSGGELTSCRYSLISSFSLSGSEPAVTAIAPSDPPLLYCAAGGEVSVYDLTVQQEVRRVSCFRTAVSRVRAFAFAPDGTRVFTAHHDRRVRVWARTAQTLPQAAAAAANKSESAGLSSPSSSSSSSTPYSAPVVLLQKHRLVASLPTLFDRLCRAILPRNYVTVRRHRRLLWIDHADAVSSLAATPDGALLYSGSWDKTVKVWSANSLRCLESIPAHDDAVNAVAVGRDGTVYTASADRRIRVWTWPQSPQSSPPPRSRSWYSWKWKRKTRRHEPAAILERHRSAVNALAVSPDGSILYSGACDRSVVVWEREDRAGHMQASGALRGHQKAIMCLCAVDDLVVSGSTDRTVRVWLRGGGGAEAVGAGAYRCLAVLAGHRKGVRSVAACRVGPGPGPGPDGSPTLSGSAVEYRVCSGSADGEVRVWRLCVGNGTTADDGSGGGEGPDPKHDLGS